MTPDEQRDLRSPLHWPAGYPRTKSPRRNSRLGQRVRLGKRIQWTLGMAVVSVLDELKRLSVHYPIISTDLTIRNDGLPYADQGDSCQSVDDTGVAVYFMLRQRDGKLAQRVIACDRWDRVRDNLRAISLTIEAMRGLERWGCSDVLARTLEAFAALPPSAEDWRTVLGLGQHATLDECKAAHRKLAFENHPDQGGRADEMAKVNAAYDNAQRELES